jgi:hypothetical protein
MKNRKPAPKERNINSPGFQPGEKVKVENRPRESDNENGIDFSDGMK